MSRFQMKVDVTLGELFTVDAENEVEAYEKVAEILKKRLNSEFYKKFSKYAEIENLNIKKHIWTRPC